MFRITNSRTHPRGGSIRLGERNRPILERKSLMLAAGCLAVSGAALTIAFGISTFLRLVWYPGSILENPLRHQSAVDYPLATSLVVGTYLTTQLLWLGRAPSTYLEISQRAKDFVAKPKLVL